MSAVVDQAERHVLALRQTPRDQWGTRDRILLAASQLFAVHGFRGASTRDIADLVGIRQPSLFKHFGAKRDLLSELAVFDVQVPAEHARRAAGEQGTAEERLTTYLTWDLEWYRTMPFDLRGMDDSLVSSEGLADAGKALTSWNRSIHTILKQGAQSGEFEPGAIPFVPSVIETLSWHMVRTRSASPQVVDDGVRFVLRAVSGT